MIKFNHNAKHLYTAFGITPTDLDLMDKVSRAKPTRASYKNRTSWFAQRIWLDERLSDNAKCYMLFTLGRFYEMNKLWDGE